MKKIILSLVICCVSISAFALTHPKITPAYIAAEKAKNTEWSKVNVIFAELPDGLTIDQQYAKMLENAKNLNIKDKIVAQVLINKYLFFGGLITKENAKTVETFIEKNGTTEQLASFYKLFAELIGADKKAIEAKLFEAFKMCHQAYIKNYISYYINLLPAIDEATAKAHLKTLNRLYSQKLLEDKSKWENIVAKIRTTLETY